MAKVHVLLAEHFSVPPVITKVFQTDNAARMEAADLTNIMLRDQGWNADATPENFQTRIERLADYHGAAHCYVEIIEREVLG